MKKIMYKMKNITFLITVIFFIPTVTLSVKAQDNIQQQKDSLLNLISNTNDEEKMLVLDNLIYTIYQTEENIDSVLKYFTFYEKEAENQKNIPKQGYIKSFLLDALYNHSRIDLYNERVDKYLDFMKENELWSYYYSSQTTRFEIDIERVNTQTALDRAQKIYNEAKTQNNAEGLASAAYMLGHAYHKMNRYDDAEQYYKQCISIINTNKLMTSIIEDSFDGLCKILLNAEKPDEALQSLKQWEDAIIKLDEYQKQVATLSWYNLYNVYSKAYYMAGDYESALKYIELTRSLGLENEIADANYYYYSAFIFVKNGDYSKALNYLNHAAEAGKIIGDHKFMNDILELKAEILCFTGQGEEGSKLYEQVIEYADSIRNADFNGQLDELRTQYEVDIHIAEKEKARLSFYFAMGIGVLLLVVLLIYFLYSRRLKQRNLALYQQVQELSRKEKAVESCFLSKPEETLSKEMQLFRQLSELMKTEKLFIDTDINRKKLADLLGTNEIYLANAIRQGRSETFSDYISNLRLQYALDLMEKHSEMKFDSIAIDSGHGSYSQFFRSFSKRYGLTPSEYRKMSVKKS
jgi:Transcriptional regulator containing an amidase domain and an AraC-type DNA-binding HTH domain